jgi:hypothetical protein
LAGGAKLTAAGRNPEYPSGMRPSKKKKGH